MSTTALHTILDEMRQMLNEVDGASLDAFAARVLAAPRVFVTGKARSGLMARAFAMRLMHLGCVVHVVGETTTPALAHADLLVAVSGSGTTSGTVHVAQQARQMGAAITAVATRPESPRADGAALRLVVLDGSRMRAGDLILACCPHVLPMPTLKTHATSRVLSPIPVASNPHPRAARRPLSTPGCARSPSHPHPRAARRPLSTMWRGGRGVRSATRALHRTDSPTLAPRATGTPRVQFLAARSVVGPRALHQRPGVRSVWREA